MNGCILHYGMHKTGSSSIQDSLHRGLADPRFHYVDLGRPNASAELTLAFSATPERQNMARKRGLDRAALQPEIDAARARLESEFAHAARATCILSAEHVVHLKPPELRQLARFLHERAGDVRAVGYVRAPASYMESVFQQHVKGGRPDFDIERTFPRYRNRFGRLEEAFGRGQVEYWPFDPRAFPGGCVVRDFCTRLGIDFDPGAVVRSNEALSLPALRLLYAYRRFGPGYGSGQRAVRENFALVRALAELQGPRLRFHASLVAPVLAQHREEIDWMESRVGVPLRGTLHEDDGALRGEQDLLRFTDTELAWLAAATGGADVPPQPEAVAARMGVLRGQLQDTGRETRGAAGLLGALRRWLGR